MQRTKREAKTKIPKTNNPTNEQNSKIGKFVFIPKYYKKQLIQTSTNILKRIRTACIYTNFTNFSKINNILY